MVMVREEEEEELVVGPGACPMISGYEAATHPEWDVGNFFFLI